VTKKVVGVFVRFRAPPASQSHPFYQRNEFVSKELKNSEIVDSAILKENDRLLINQPHP
jgi:hypothetical protein